MSTYRRPEVEAPVFLDEHGRVIEFGNRWPDGPPEDTYSVDTHPERFAPLHAVAEALIAHLDVTFDVETVDDDGGAVDLVVPGVPAVRAVRVVPADPRCSPLTFVFTAYPGVVVHAGLLQRFFYPSCGCDACDEPWESVADELEDDVLGIVAGGLRESVRAGREPWIEYSLTTSHGMTSAATAADVSRDRLRGAESVLRELGGAWAPWPRLEPREGSGKGEGDEREG